MCDNCAENQIFSQTTSTHFKTDEVFEIVSASMLEKGLKNVAATKTVATSFSSLSRDPSVNIRRPQPARCETQRFVLCVFT